MTRIENTLQETCLPRHLEITCVSKGRNNLCVQKYMDTIVSLVTVTSWICSALQWTPGHCLSLSSFEGIPLCSVIYSAGLLHCPLCVSSKFFWWRTQGLVRKPSGGQTGIPVILAADVTTTGDIQQIFPEWQMIFFLLVPLKNKFKSQSWWGFSLITLKYTA